MILFVAILLISLFLVKSILAKWFDPRHAQLEANRQLHELAIKVDSLAIEVDRKDRFIANFQRVLSGDTTEMVDPAKILTGGDKPLVRETDLHPDPRDSAFRRDFEQSGLSLVNYTDPQSREVMETFFFTPIAGFISDRYDVKKGHFGVDVVARANEPIKSIADGTVIMASWTQDSGNVIAIQHRGNLISVYKHNAELLKKVGTFVNAGEIVAIVGNSGEMTDGPHLHFELWYNGNSLNPEEFVTF